MKNQNDETNQNGPMIPPPLDGGAAIPPPLSSPKQPSTGADGTTSTGGQVDANTAEPGSIPEAPKP